MCPEYMMNWRRVDKRQRMRKRVPLVDFGVPRETWVGGFSKIYLVPIDPMSPPRLMHRNVRGSAECDVDSGGEVFLKTGIELTLTPSHTHDYYEEKQYLRVYDLRSIHHPCLCCIFTYCC